METNKAVVYLWQGGTHRVVGMVELTQYKEEVASRFVYDEAYLRDEYSAAIDPLGLPLVSGIQETAGLFLVFNDACPDSWGKHLLDIEAEHNETRPQLFEYLTCQDSDNRIGALGFGPDRSGPKRIDPPWRRPYVPGETLDLLAMIKAVDAVLHHDALPEQYRRFLVRGSSVGGAQPKAVVDYETTRSIAKFSRELEYVPVCRLESAALQLAARCAIRVPASRVVRVGGRDVLLVERFDRTGDAGRLHLISAQTLTGAADMRKGSYLEIADHMRRLCAHQTLKSDLEELFRRMVFNILINNYDDHLKNHSFIYDEHLGGYRLSPAYDVVPQPPLAEKDRAEMLTLEIGDKGRIATIDNALTGCRSFGLTRERAEQIAASMIDTVSRNWVAENENAGVSPADIRKITPSYTKNAPDHHNSRT